MPKRTKQPKPDPRPPEPPRPTDPRSEMEHQLGVIRNFMADAVGPDPAAFQPAFVTGGAGSWRLSEQMSLMLDAQFAREAGAIASGATIPTTPELEAALDFFSYKMPAGTGSSRMGGPDMERPGTAEEYVRKARERED